MSDPQNALLNGDGFRFYRWTDAVTGQEHDLLSVTSIRKLCGEPYQLVNWQLGNLIDTVMGTVKRPKIGKRGKPLKGQYVYVPEEKPSQFLAKYAEATTQDDYDKLRRWVRESADEPRNIAARRGTLVHAAIEKQVASHRIERDWVEAEFLNLSDKDRKAAKNGVSDEDIDFIRASVANWEDLRKNVPFVVVAKEPQVFNLEHGYGGSADNILWFLPEGSDREWWQKQAERKTLTLDRIQGQGGWLAVGDNKTSKDVYTSHVVQIHAYGAAEFVGEDGVVNHRLTDILQAAQRGVILHIRPEHWAVHTFDFNEPTYRAFFGSVAFARYLAEYPRPQPLFIGELDHIGNAEES